MNLITIVNGVNIYFNRTIQEFIDQEFVFGMGSHHALGVVNKFVLLHRDTHALSAQYITGTNEYRVTNAIGNFNSAFHRIRRTVIWKWNIQFGEEIRERAAVFGKIDHLKIGAVNMDARFNKALAKL